MSTDELLCLATSVIQTIDPNTSFITDEVLENLGSIFPEKLIIAALDLIDRRNVIHYVTPWGHTEYEVLGSTEMGTNMNPGEFASSYSVLLDIQTSPIPYSCSCPAFLHSVIRLETHIMCKHILAVMIARQMSMSIARPTSVDDLAALFMRQFPEVKAEADLVRASDSHHP